MYANALFYKTHCMCLKNFLYAPLKVYVCWDNSIDVLKVKNCYRQVEGDEIFNEFIKVNHM